MKKNRIWLYLLATAAGAAAICLGGFVLVDERLKMVSGLCIGLGSAAFSLGLGNFIGALALSKIRSEELARRKTIEMNDERNTRIREKAGAKANQIVVYALSAIVLAMGILQVSLVAIILVAAVLLLEFVLAVALNGYYSRRM